MLTIYQLQGFHSELRQRGGWLRSNLHLLPSIHWSIGCQKNWTLNPPLPHSKPPNCYAKALGLLVEQTNESGYPKNWMVTRKPWVDLWPKMPKMWGRFFRPRLWALIHFTWKWPQWRPILWVRCLRNVDPSVRGRAGDDIGEWHCDSSSVQNGGNLHMFNFLHQIHGSFSMEGLPKYLEIVCFKKTKLSLIDPSPICKSLPLLFFSHKVRKRTHSGVA